jgi:hypothetical protein
LVTQREARCGVPAQDAFLSQEAGKVFARRSFRDFAERDAFDRG